jgi:hypothetical protein
MDTNTSPAIASTSLPSRPVAESAAPPERPALKRGDDTLTSAESALLLGALGTLLAVMIFVLVA